MKKYTLNTQGEHEIERILLTEHKYYAFNKTNAKNVIKYYAALAEIDAAETGGIGYIRIDYEKLIQKYPPRWTCKEQRAFVIAKKFFRESK